MKFIKSFNKRFVMHKNTLSGYGGYSCFHLISQVDEYDNPVVKTKQEFPYSYDGFVTYRAGKNEEANQTAYSDRLMQEDYKKARTLMQKHFGETGDWWNSRNPEKIEAFLQEWLGDTGLKLILMMQYCNQSNGNPYWRFDYKKTK
jgi:hypothetical protein